jgi:SOS response regulatory protein OraA/RecX
VEPDGGARPGGARSVAAWRASAEASRARRGAVTDLQVVMEAAALFLAARPRSAAETGRRLRELGYRPDLVDAVLARLTELGYLDDESFARAWVESRDRARPRGEIALRRELALKGIEREIVDGILAERSQGSAAADVPEGSAAADVPEGSAAADVPELRSTPVPAGHSPDLAVAGRLLASRRAALDREPDLRKRRQRAYALLARNGFDLETCREAVASLDTQTLEDGDWGE